MATVQFLNVISVKFNFVCTSVNYTQGPITSVIELTGLAKLFIWTEVF
jgi:hypothetical protein